MLTSCPSPDQLRKLGAGALPEEEASSVESHLLACDRCVRQLQAWQDNTTSLTDPTPTPGGSSSPAAELLERIAQEAIAAQAPPTEELPRPFGDYVLLALLGKGGMGVVYKARQRSANRFVALKLIRPDQVSRFLPEERAKALARFRNEVQAAARLEHDHVVTVYDVGEIEGQAYYAMRLVEGESLKELLADGPLDPLRAARYTEQVASALAEAHAHGILHRDLKPHNVMIDRRNDRALLADFGLAKILEADQELTATSAVMGSPPYMSPEQTRDSGTVTAASDVYSLGATLYHLLTGRPPFLAATMAETTLQVQTQEPVGVRELNPSVPLDLETICLKCLSKEPSQRYASAQDLADDLHRFQSGEAIRARPISQIERAWRWCQRNPTTTGLLVSLGVLLLLITGISIFSYVRVSSDTRTLSLLTSKRLTHESQKALPARPLTALRLAIASAEVTYDYNGTITPESETALREVLGVVGGEPIKGEEGQDVLGLSCDGRWLVTQGADLVCRLRDLHAASHAGRNLDCRGTPCRALRHDLVAIGGDSRWLAIVTRQNQLWLWDLHAPNPTEGPRMLSVGVLAYSNPLSEDPEVRAQATKRREVSGEPRRLFFSADGRWLVHSGDGVRVWDTQALETKTSPTLICDLDFYATWLHDGKERSEIAAFQRFRAKPAPAASPPHTVRQGEPNEPRAPLPTELTIRERHNPLDPGQPYYPGLLSIPERTASYDAGQARYVYSDPPYYDDVAISPDGRWLVTSGGHQAVVRRWDLSAPDPHYSGKLIANDYFRFIGITSDSRWLVADRLAEGRLIVWDLLHADPPSIELVLDPNWQDIVGVEMSREGDWLATVLSDNSLHIYDLRSHEPFRTRRTLSDVPEGIKLLAFSPRGRWLAAASSEALRVWDLDFSRVQVLRGHDRPIERMTIGPHGLVTVGDDGALRRWDLTSGSASYPRTFDMSSGAGRAGRRAISPDGEHLIKVIGSTPQIHDLNPSAESVRTHRLSGFSEPLSDLVVSRNGQWLVALGSQSGIAVWDLRTADPAAAPRVSYQHVGVNSVSQSADGRWMVTVASTFEDTHSIQVCDLQAAEPAKSIVSLVARLSTKAPEAAVVEDAPPLAPVPKRSPFPVHGTGQHPQRETIPPPSVDVPPPPPPPPPDMCVPPVPPADAPEPSDSAPCKSDAVGCGNPTLPPYWLIGGARGIQTLVFVPNQPFDGGQPFDGPSQPVDFGAERFSRPMPPPLRRIITNDGRWLIAEGERRFSRVWDLHAPDLAGTYRDSPGSPRAASHDSHWLASGGDRDLALVELASGAARRKFQGERRIYDVAFSPDDRWLCAASEGEWLLWDLRSEATPFAPLVLRTVPANAQQDSEGDAPRDEHRGFRPVFSPNGRWLVSQAGSGELVVWDTWSATLNTGCQKLGSYPLFTDISVDPSNRWFIAWDPGGTARVWLLDPLDLLHLARLVAGRPLGSEERDRYGIPQAKGAVGGSQILPRPGLPQFLLPGRNFPRGAGVILELPDRGSRPPRKEAPSRVVAPPTVVFDPLAKPGVIEGELLYGDRVYKTPFARVWLEKANGDETAFEQKGGGAFRFENVPPGKYRLEGEGSPNGRTAYIVVNDVEPIPTEAPRFLHRLNLEHEKPPARKPEPGAKFE